MSDLTRSQSPQPYPRQLPLSGALYGPLPLTLPRKMYKSSHITIVARDEGVTTYAIRRHMDNDDAVVHGLLDTSNEWLLMAGLYLHWNPDLKQYRVRIGDIPVARIVAGQQPPNNPDRIVVDHANGKPLDNRAANLHWVTARFNTFNRAQKKPPPSKFFGVTKSGSRWKVNIAGQQSGTYKSKETAAVMYNLLAELIFGDQLRKTPHLLNRVDTSSRSSKVWSQSDGADVYQVDNIFVTIYDAKFKGSYKTLKAAKQAAQKLVVQLRGKQAQKEKKWAERRKQLKISDRHEGSAYIACKVKGTEVKVLISDKSWLDIKACSATVNVQFGRATIRLDGKTVDLARWLVTALPTDIVDHKNRQPLDNRLTNLKITDRAGNGQNCPQEANGGWKGVRLVGDRWRVTIKVKGQPRAANRSFENSELDKALELYDLAALHQHEPGAYLNLPDKLFTYISMLENKKTLSYVKEFLAGKGPHSSIYKGVWAVRDFFKGGLKGCRTRSAHGKGAEVRLGIAHDFERLTRHRDLMVNFEWMRPWYLHQLARWQPQNEDRLIERAYRLLGGDAFADAERANNADGLEELDSPPATSSPTPSPSRKRKRESTA